MGRAAVAAAKGRYLCWPGGHERLAFPEPLFPGSPGSLLSPPTPGPAPPRPTLLLRPVHGAGRLQRAAPGAHAAAASNGGRAECDADICALHRPQLPPPGAPALPMSLPRQTLLFLAALSAPWLRRGLLHGSGTAVGVAMQRLYVQRCGSFIQLPAMPALALHPSDICCAVLCCPVLCCAVLQVRPGQYSEDAFRALDFVVAEAGKPTCALCLLSSSKRLSIGNGSGGPLIGSMALCLLAPFLACSSVKPLNCAPPRRQGGTQGDSQPHRQLEVCGRCGRGEWLAAALRVLNTSLEDWGWQRELHCRSCRASALQPGAAWVAGNSPESGRTS